MEGVLQEQSNFLARLSDMEMDSYARGLEDAMFVDSPNYGICGWLGLHYIILSFVDSPNYGVCGWLGFRYFFLYCAFARCI